MRPEVLRILGYGCTSSAGPTTTDYWEGLCAGIDHSDDMYPRVCAWDLKNTNRTVKEILSQEMLRAWEQTLNLLSPIRKERLRADKNIGVIFASTKGCLEDYIWKIGSAQELSDPFTPVLNEFIRISEISSQDFISVSNGCTSGIGALFLAERWLLQKRLQHVVIVSADRVGPFVKQGFSSLKALTLIKSKPFSFDRDGLQLGEAASAILLTRTPPLNEEIGVSDFSPHFFIKGLGFETEGFAVTKPSDTGKSLSAACAKALSSSSPDLVIAHGTGTLANDKTEDHVLSLLFNKKVPITGTKWSIGHTLGSSASMDIIAACESLRSQTIFSLFNSEIIDPTFKAEYFHGAQGPRKTPLKNILVTSLGFGGVNGAVLIEGQII